MKTPHSTFVEKLYSDIDADIENFDYPLVFDIVRHSRSEFIKKNAHRHNKKNAKIYDLAQGYATQIRRLFRKNNINQAIEQTWSSPSGSLRSLKGIKKEGPTYQTLFNDNWSSYCQQNAPEANDSPVSYLSWLYQQALGFERDMGEESGIIPLSRRRPDLANMLLDDDAFHQALPALQIVNMILEQSVGPYVTENYPDIAVDDVLSTTRYPTVLPYHYPHQQVLLTLTDLGGTLQDIIKKTDPAWPYFVNDILSVGNAETAWLLGSDLAPDQLAIISEAEIPDSDSVGLSSFYVDDLGANTGSADFSAFEDVSFFCQQLGITSEQLEQLIACTAGTNRVVVSLNYPAGVANPTNYGAKFCNNNVSPALSLLSESNTIVALSDDRMQRLNRIVRLQRWLALPYDQVDLLLCAARGTALTPDENTLRMLGVFQHYQQKFSVTAHQFAAVLDTITPYALAPETPFFDRVFNSPALFETPFVITDLPFDYTQDTGEDGRTVKQLCAGLAINQAQFQLLANQVYLAQALPDDAPNTLRCSLAVVSALYRLVMVPRWLGLSFAEGIALLTLLEKGNSMGTLAGVPQYAPLTDGQPTASDILDTLMALADTVGWLRDNTLSPLVVLAYVQTTQPLLPATATELNLVVDINQQLPDALLNEAVFESCGVPNQQQDGSAIDWMSTLQTVVDGQGLVLPVKVSDGQSVMAALMASVSEAIQSLTLDNMSLDQATDILANVIYQAKQVQDGIADSSLAKVLNIDHSLPASLLGWSGSDEHAFLSLTLDLKGISTPEAVSPEYLTLLYQIAKRASICTTFMLSPAMLSTFIPHADWFIGTSDLTITLNMLYQLSAYQAWLSLTRQEDAVLAYLNWVNDVSSTVPDALTAAKTLAELIQWEPQEVQQAAAYLTSDYSDNTGIAKTAAQVAGVIRFKTLSMATGVATSALILTSKLNKSSTYADWQTVGESFISTQNSVGAA
ncbi:hypothetical protein L7E84_004718 [Salmonella enterica]|nr:hypothetical protein [Salmonella enterica]